MSKSRSRQSISSTHSTTTISNDNSTTFEQFLSMQPLDGSQVLAESVVPIAPEPKRSSKYGIHVQRNKVAMQKLANNFIELNKQKVEKRERGQSTWRNLIKGVLDLQRGKIPLLLAVEAGNQSMCRELLSAQTAEQLKVSFKLIFVLIKNRKPYFLLSKHNQMTKLKK